MALPRPLSLALLAIACTGACTSASADTNSRVIPPVHGGSAPPPAAAPPTTRTSSSAPAGRIVYDFAAHVEHAELRRGESLILDLGETGGAKYALGGWGTRVVPGLEVDGATTAFVRGSYGDVLLPVHQRGPLVIEARVRAPRDGEVTAYLGDDVVLRTKLAKEAFSTVRIDVPAGKLAVGEHMLRLRGSGMGRIENRETAIAIDWVAVGPTPVGELAPPRQAALVPEPGMLAVPAGTTLGYALEVDPGARLAGELAQGQLAVRAVRDDLSSVPLAELRAGQKLDVDLAALAGKVVRIDFTASSDARLTRPRVLVPAAAARTLREPVKNVIVYLIDTLRADHLTAFNPQTRVRTPGLDGLVAQGAAVFASAHTQENWTKPSVATLLSSLMPWEHHAITTEAVVPRDIDMLPEILEKHGFYSGAFIANGYVSEKFGFKQGWDTWRNYVREGRYNRAEFLAADAVAWLDARPASLPFFLYMHAIDPHVPYKPTGQFMSLYDPEPYNGVVDFSDDNTLLEKIKIGSIKLKDRDKRRLEALYDSEISYHDLHFKTLLTALEKRNLADNTMIVVVADHGEEFWDHGSVGHGHSVYEELLRIPMVVRVPGLTDQPMRIESSSGLVDVLPTVMEALGLPLPANLSGRSLMPELRGDALDAPRVTVSGFMDGWRTAVVGRLKLIQRTEKRVMLHDLGSDPREQVDVAAQRPISTRYVRGQLGLALHASEPVQAGSSSGKKRHKEEKTTIDAETEAQLRALGYIGTSRR
jgi:choline-sulfatase